MPQLLLEFFSEEIPARMQKRAEGDLARLMGEALKAAGFDKLRIRTLSGPRRIALIADELPAATPDVNEERKGPKVGAPQQALAGFMRAASLARIEDAQVQKDSKGDFYVARISKRGRATSGLIAEIVPKIAREFPWPKSMRSAASDFTWVRPLHSVLCVFDGAPVRFEIGAVTSGDQTQGHRFHAPGAISVRNANEYEAKLRDAYVLTDREARKAKIMANAKAACAARGLDLVEDTGLLEEVAGLAEWPVIVLGDMDPAFLDLPPEVIRLTMRTHQRYFAVRDKAGKLTPHFITIANVEAKDGGAAIAAGNARVLSARLNDARFFWENDKKVPLEARVEKLKQIVFHQKLGSVWDKVERVRALAKELAPIVNADPDLVDRAALLAKADLVTETVGEFPELQGQIGRQLYLLQNGMGANLPLNGGAGREAAGGGDRDAAHRLPQTASSSSSRARPPQSAQRADSSPIEGELGVVAVANAIEDHYRPVGPNDRVPSDPVALAVALADKLDTLVGFWAIDEKPTGSRDPYALRRAALGVVRVTIDNKLHANLHGLAESHLQTQFRMSPAEASGLSLQVVYFVLDRLRVQLRDTGKRHDLLDAVMETATSATDWPLISIVARVEALEGFLKTDDGAALLALYRRAANILKAEEKKDASLAAALTEPGAFDQSKLTLPAERALLAGLEEAGAAAKTAVAAERFEAAMAALAQLRAPLDRFFDEVLVNDPDSALRKARLLLLARIRDALHQVADFSRIEG